MTTNYVTPTAGEQILVKASLDGGNTYNVPMFINMSRAFTITVAANTDKIVDMNNPSNPSQVLRSSDSVDTKIDGSGIHDMTSILTWTQLALAGQPIPLKVQTISNASTMTITGYYLMTSYAFTGEEHKKATCSVTFEQASIPTVTSP